jgi:hypothetical protein
MTLGELDRLLIAPEVIVVDLVEAALCALERALLVEHPLLGAPPSADDPPIRRRARAVLVPVARLRRALRAYRRAVRDVIHDAQANDLPF